MTPPAPAPAGSLTLRDISPGWGCFWMIPTLFLSSKKEKKEFSPPVLRLLPTLDGTRKPWGAGELVLLIPPPGIYPGLEMRQARCHRCPNTQLS